MGKTKTKNKSFWHDLKKMKKEEWKQLPEFFLNFIKSEELLIEVKK